MSTPSLPNSDEMRRALRRRDPSYDGVFFTGVRTTGIFCRPSCPARKPLPGNVEFFPTAREALFAGYRPCLRCRPLAIGGEPPEWVVRLLADVDADPGRRLTARELRRLGVEPARARRFFQEHYGLSFVAYCRARRLGGALNALREGATLDAAALDHGFESLSGFRDAFKQLFGRPPGRGRDSDCVTVGWLTTPLGPMVAGATREGVCLLEFTDRRMLEAQLRTLERRLRLAAVPGTNAPLERLRDELGAYFQGARHDFEVPLVAPGTPFQEQVWAALRHVPYGATRSYAELARAIGQPSAVRAVARANGMNRIAILIPCHRIVESNGGLGGYGGGLWRKRRLLALERGQAVLDGVSAG